MSDNKPIEFTRDGLERVRLYSGHDLAKMPATAADLVAALQANSQLRVAVLSGLGLDADTRGLSQLVEGWREKLRLAESELAEAKTKINNQRRVLSGQAAQGQVETRWRIDVTGMVARLESDLAAERARVAELAELAHGWKNEVRAWARDEVEFEQQSKVECANEVEAILRSSQQPAPTELVFTAQDGEEVICPNCDYVGPTPHACRLKPPASPSTAARSGSVDVEVPACSACNDTHVVTRGGYGDERQVMCTSCPVPCQKCRAGFTGAYCGTPRCACDCHKRPVNPPQPPAPDSPGGGEQCPTCCCLRDDNDYCSDSFHLKPPPLTLADVDRRIAQLARAASEACGKVSSLGWPLAKLAEVAGRSK